MAITMSHTALISIIVESLTFGCFTVLFFYSQTILMILNRERGYNKPLWAACIVMWILALTHFAIDAFRINAAFLDQPNNDFADSEAFLTDLSSPSFVSKSAVYEAQTIIGDACIIWRTYMVWGKNYSIIILPVLLCLGNAVTGGVLVEQFATLPVSSTIFVLSPWGVAYIFTTLLTNIFCTFSIALRIWWQSRKNSYYGALSKHNALQPVMITIVESGALYSASLIAVVAAFMSSSWGHFIVLDSLSSIIGITFTMIIIWLYHVEQTRSAASLPSIHSATTHPGRRVSMNPANNAPHPHRYSSHVVDIKKNGTFAPSYYSDAARVAEAKPAGARMVPDSPPLDFDEADVSSTTRKYVNPYAPTGAAEQSGYETPHDNSKTSHPYGRI